MRPAAGDVAVLPVAVGGYGACQVTGTDHGVVTVDVLAWESAELPELPELAGVPPMILDHHAHTGEPARTMVDDGPPPPGWVWLGSLPLPAPTPVRADASSGWAWVPAEIAAQRRWDRHLPGAVKQAYRAAGTRGRIEVDLGAGPVTLGAAIGRLDLTGAGPVAPPPAGPVHWAALDDLARCTSLVWAGPDRGLVAALAGHPIVQDLTWTGAEGDLDLRGTGLTSLSVGGEIGLLQLPDRLTSLHLMAGARVGTVAAGPWLRLTMTGAYGLDAGTLPDLPALTALAIHGLRRPVATAVKARYRRTDLRVTGARA